MKRWRKPELPTFALLLRLALFVLPCAASAAPDSGLAPPPPCVADGSAQRIGPSTEGLHVALGLRHPDPEGEEQAASGQHRFLSPQEWNARFAPSAESEQAIVDWAQSQGLIVTRRFPNRLIVDVEGSAEAVGKAFQVGINRYQCGDVEFYANDREPQLPERLSGLLLSVMGLDDFHRLHANGPHPGR